MLPSTVPDTLEMLTDDVGLPRLCNFLITLHLPRAGARDTMQELARHIRE
ncbi:hypothetical protein FG93_02227 [Bosea sp. LC85]|nr:hypothetical protein [Bosea sp. LC85]KFC72776.1 hypothetical protein FG93_02227 [Bosea sp. LC85]